MRALRAPLSVARYSSSAASDRLRTRPNRSSSKAVTPRPARHSLCTPALPLGFRSAGLCWRVPLACAPMVGSRSARCTRYMARAASTLSSVLRRSRLLASAVSISPRSDGSVTKSRHSSEAADGPASDAAPPGRPRSIAARWARPGVRRWAPWRSRQRGQDRRRRDQRLETPIKILQGIHRSLSLIRRGVAAVAGLAARGQHPPAHSARPAR